MKWFGESWRAPVCADAEHAATPIGKRCPVCDRAIREGDQGLLIPYLGSNFERAAYHIDCFMNSIGVPPAMRPFQ